MVGNAALAKAFYEIILVVRLKVERKLKLYKIFELFISFKIILKSEKISYLVDIKRLYEKCLILCVLNLCNS